MAVFWAATSPTTGSFVPAEQDDYDGLIARFGELRDQGQGYLEVRGDAQFPLLTLGFRGERGVVQLVSDEATTALLVADPSATKDAEVLVIDDFVEFASEFVLSLDRAWQVIDKFARGGDPAQVGEWWDS
ncbi:hypothetical protein AB1046_00495 [Promicromonospora sp. Populi]|uniref:hypothetical protein n=1 Tax=Promicromonospora sp. Populi TaxID=3239420 RepID=UPI0034E2D069